MSNEQLREALQVLEANHGWHKEYDDLDAYVGSDLYDKNVGAIRVIKEALAQPTADHIPDSGQMVQPAAPVDEQVEALARKHGTGGWQTLADMVRFGKACMALQSSADVRNAVLAEREACAKVADIVANTCLHPNEIAAAIRARSEGGAA